MTTSSSTISRSELTRSLDLFEVKPGVKFSTQVLKDLLPDVETALFFAKVYELDHVQLSELLFKVFKTPLTEALFGGDHSLELQDYISEVVDVYDLADIDAESISYAPTVPHGEILPQVWESLQVEIADSIKAVAAKLESVVHAMPGKQGQMLFKSLNVMNAKRPTLGDHRALIHHAPQKQNLLVLDVSGSMTEGTVRTIIDDVVALAYTANAHLAIVSNTCSYWEPGTFDSDTVLAKAEFGGTYYEQLAPLFRDRDWGVVVTVADYDSSPAAKDVLAQCNGRIDEVIDVSLVSRPTYLAKCVGQLASEVRPILVGNSQDVLGSTPRYW